MPRFWVLVLLAATQCHAQYIDATEKDMVLMALSDCNSQTLDFKRGIDSVVAFNMAFHWTGTNSLSDWEYGEAYTTEEDMKCVDYRYRTRMKVPHFFEQYLGSLSVNLKISKTTCANETVFEDHAVVETPMLIPEVRTSLHCTQDDHYLTSITKTRYALPWMLSFLQDAITRHIMSKCKQKVGVLTSELCVQPSTFAVMPS